MEGSNRPTGWFPQHQNVQSQFEVSVNGERKPRLREHAIRRPIGQLAPGETTEQITVRFNGLVTGIAARASMPSRKEEQVEPTRSMRSLAQTPDVQCKSGCRCPIGFESVAIPVAPQARTRNRLTGMESSRVTAFSKESLF